MLSWDKTPALATIRQCRAWVEIDLEALQHNVQQVTRHIGPSTTLMAVVKADAYGHGAIAIADAALAAGAGWLGVATVPEGVELREAGITAPIMIMGAINSPEEVAAIARWRNASSASGRRSEVEWLEERPSMKRLTDSPMVVASVACSTRPSRRTRVAWLPLETETLASSAPSFSASPTTPSARRRSALMPDLPPTACRP